MHSGGLTTTSVRRYPLDSIEAQILDLKTLLGFQLDASARARCLTEIIRLRAVQAANEQRISLFDPSIAGTQPVATSLIPGVVVSISSRNENGPVGEVQPGRLSAQSTTNQL